MDQEDRDGRAEKFATWWAIWQPRRCPVDRSVDDLVHGLAAAGQRRSMDPMAVLTAPKPTTAQHQSMLHFAGKRDWSDAVAMARLRAQVQSYIQAQGAISAGTIDDTGFPREGRQALAFQCISA